MRRLSFEEYVERFRVAHGDDYDYSGDAKRVIATCRHCEREFRVAAVAHSRGQGRCGCPPTRREYVVEKPLDKETKYLKRFESLYENGYRYTRCFERDGMKFFVFTDPLGETHQVRAHEHANGYDPAGNFSLHKDSAPETDPIDNN